MNTISIAIPNFMRKEMVVESFEQVLNDERISEIVIVDDASPDDSFEWLQQRFQGNDKIRLLKNDTNLDCYRNKHRAIKLTRNQYCILLDSDNIIDKSYIDKLYEYQQMWSPDAIFQPSFAKPHFDFTKYASEIITKENVHHYLGLPMFDTMLNAMNYFVNRNSYLEVWDDSVDPHTSDSIFQAYNWLKAGKSIFVVPELHYIHRVHDESHYKLNNHKDNGFYDEVIRKLKELR